MGFGGEHARWLQTACAVTSATRARDMSKCKATGVKTKDEAVFIQGREKMGIMSYSMTTCGSGFHLGEIHTDIK